MRRAVAAWGARFGSESALSLETECVVIHTLGATLEDYQNNFEMAIIDVAYSAAELDDKEAAHMRVFCTQDRR